MSLFSKKSDSIDTDFGAYWVLLGLIVIIPSFVYVTASVPPAITKVGLAGVLVCVMLALFSIGAIRAQVLSVPRSWLLASAWLLPMTYALSTAFNTDAGSSIFGERLSMDTLAFMFVCVTGLTLVSVLLTTQKKALFTYFAFIISATVVAVAQLFLFFGRGMVEATGAVFTSLSVLGTLNDLATFFGLITLFVLFSLLLLPITGLVRGVLAVVLAGSLYFLAVVNLFVLWWILGMFALAVFVYSLIPQKDEKVGSRVSYASLVTLVVCGMFLFVSPVVTSKIAEWANVGELDVRPSWQTTIGVGRAVFSEHAFLGIGPGSFEQAWSLHMPEVINRTNFWQANFSYGIGFVPTAIIATGILGAIAWLMFFVWFLAQGVRSLVLVRASIGSDVGHYVRITSFLSALYLWIVACIQVPSPAILLYAFLLTGVFIASLSFGVDTSRPFRIVFSDNARVGFVITLLLTVSVLTSVAGVYGFSSRVFAESLFQQGVRALQSEGDIAESERYVRSALAIRPVDAYYRLLSTLDMARLRKILEEGRPPEEVAEPVRELLVRAVGNAVRATEVNPKDYQNWLNSGTLYQNIIPLGYVEATESANVAFDQALALRPKSAYLYFAKAQIERSRGDTARAREYVEKAISLRNNYTDAIFLLAQLQIEANEVESAMQSVEAITFFEPQNPVVHFQLGLLRYGSEKFEGAVGAFERAVEIAPEYANARYFLGLAYARLGNIPRAIASFERVLETNPDNTEVKAILSNLREGKPPFALAPASGDIQNLESLPFDQASQSNLEVSNGSGVSESPLQP